MLNFGCLNFFFVQRLASIIEICSSTFFHFTRQFIISYKVYHVRGTHFFLVNFRICLLLTYLSFLYDKWLKQLLILKVYFFVQSIILRTIFNKPFTCGHLPFLFVIDMGRIRFNWW